MTTFRIRDLPIAAKSLVAPVIGALITVAIVIVVMTVTNGAIRSANEADAAERLVSAITAARLQFTQGHAALFRAVSWRAGNVSPKQVDDARNEAQAAIKRANEMMENLPATDNVRAKVDALKKLVADYRQAVTQTANTIQEDAFIATMMMTDAHERSLRVADAFQKFVDETTAESSALRAGASQALQDGVRVILAAAAIGIVLALGFAVISARLISRPVKGLTLAVSQLAEGDLSVTIPPDDRSDEIGAMTRAVIVLRQNTQEMHRLQAEQKDLEARAAATRQADMHNVANNFEAAVVHVVDAVSSAASQLEAAALTLAGAAETTQQLSGVVANASEQASNNVQSVAASTDELSASVAEISRQVHESSRIAGEAVRQAEATDVRINELSLAASRIGDVVKLITAIAEQTNLLALNATIEAARAGEAGKGFAVVAAEVKSLANQTAKATEEIGSQIAGMQAATNDSVAAIREISGTIGRISEIASTIAAAVEEQGTATQEISNNVQEAAKGTSHVATNIVDVTRAATGTGSASSQVLSSAKALSSEGSRLKTEVDKFLATVRAA